MFFAYWSMRMIWPSSSSTRPEGARTPVSPSLQYSAIENFRSSGWSAVTIRECRSNLGGACSATQNGRQVREASEGLRVPGASRIGNGLNSNNRSAAPSKSSLFHGVAGVLALPKKLLVGHDRLSGMMHPPVLHIRPIIGNPNHETGRLHDQVE